MSNNFSYIFSEIHSYWFILSDHTLHLFVFLAICTVEKKKSEFELDELLQMKRPPVSPNYLKSHV